MCSHENITWEIIDNSVIDRMIDNSLIHKFKPLQKIRRRTKVLNAELKKNRIKNYNQYVKLKTNVLRNVINDTDSDDCSDLTDIDYDIIYSSPTKQANYVVENNEKLVLTNQADHENYKSKYKVKNKRKNEEERREVVKSPRTKHTTAIEKYTTDTGWQEIKTNSNTSRLHNQKSRNSEENILKNQNTRCEDEQVRENHGDSDAKNDKVHHENKMTFSTTKSESKKQNREDQSTKKNESNSNKSNSLINSEDIDSNKLSNQDSRFLTNVKNQDNTSASCKLKLKNVKRNLTSILEKTDFNNDKDIKEIDKNIEDKINYSQLFSSTLNFDQHNTPLKETKSDVSKIQDSLPRVSLLDHQKDSGIDEDSQDKFINIKECNKVAKNKEKTQKTCISSPKLKDQKIKIAENSKENEKNTDLKCNDIVINKISKKKKFSEKEQTNSSQIKQLKTNVEINKENKQNEHSEKIDDSIQEQQFLSLTQDCTKINHSESCYLEEKEKDNDKLKENFKEEISFQSNKVDRNTEINREDNVSSIELENLHDIRDQQQLFLKQKNVNPKSCNNILDENKKPEKNEDKEENTCPLTKVNKNMHSNEKIKTPAKQELCINIQKQQTLPTVTHSEIFNKKYKIITKEDNAKNNIETMDNIDNMDTTTKYTPEKKNTSIDYTNDIDLMNIDNQQEMIVHTEEIDSSKILESDNEEIDMNYVSPQTRKRLQQQERLNLVVNSDSSESDDRYETFKTFQKYNNSSGTNNSKENDKIKYDETTYDSKPSNALHDENIKSPKNISTPIKEMKLDSTNTMKEIKKNRDSLTSYMYKNNNLFQSTTNRTHCNNAHNNVENENSFQLKLSENDNLGISEESTNQFLKNKQSRLLNESTYVNNNENEEIERIEPMTKYESEPDQDIQIPTESRSNLNSSCRRVRPCNLQELIEDQELVVETMLPSFTLANLSEDDEAFIINVPSKVIQNNSLNQILTLKKNSIQINKNKYRILRKEVGTTSCIFATGKKQKPYKILNIKGINTVTLTERLPQDSNNIDLSNSSNVVSPVPKSIQMNNEPVDRTVI